MMIFQSNAYSFFLFSISVGSCCSNRVICSSLRHLCPICSLSDWCPGTLISAVFLPWLGNVYVCMPTIVAMTFPCMLYPSCDLQYPCPWFYRQ
ncbi:hypothetical protein IW262DRAFT_1395539 [Armillaria fumosa]|nr:hypothetical protein IW262DRAFT_1395539 [Armillaria fumosa]